MTNAISKFIVGKTYTTRSACDHDCIFAFTITHRTNATITFDYLGKSQTRRVSVYDNSESCMPLGRYSMAPVIRASDLTHDAVEDIKTEAKKVQVGTIDLTPTWEGMVPVLATILRDGTSFSARSNAHDELIRMAKLADAYVALVKAGKVEGVKHR